MSWRSVHILATLMRFEVSPPTTLGGRKPGEPCPAVPGSGWKLVLERGYQAGRIVALIHEDTAALRRVAVFDVVVNKVVRAFLSSEPL